jgi:hypothetical protein
MVLNEVQALLFPGGVWGSNIIFVIMILLFFALLLFMLRVPSWVVLILLAPAILIGGGNIISGLISSWVKVLLIIGIFAILGIAFATFTSRNK